MRTGEKYVWGVDCGSSEIKVVLCNQDGECLYQSKRKTLFPLLEHVRHALSGNNAGFSPFDEKGSLKEGHSIIATGYGRNHIDFVQDKLTEIKAHYLRIQDCFRMNEDYTIIDIGGQDAKAITIQNGKVERFDINRKCAAGTGAYIEELAHRLELRLEDLTDLSRKHDKELSLNSYCTVFAGQEVIKILMNGERVENLIYALYSSVVKRILEMTAISTQTVIFSGGVMNYHPVLMDLFQKTFPQKKFLLAPQAQYCGALGAALYGLKGRAEI